MTKLILIVLFVSASINRILEFKTIGLERNVRKERIYRVIIAAATLALAIAFCFAIRPQWFNFAQYKENYFWNAVGNIFILTAMFVWGWSKKSLGLNWSSHIASRQNHTLTESGPYKYVRHPIYTAYILLAFGVSFATANCFVSIPFVILMMLTVIRVGAEEKFMVATLGDKYQSYIQRTGKFFPPLRKINT